MYSLFLFIFQSKEILILIHFLLISNYFSLILYHNLLHIHFLSYLSLLCFPKFLEKYKAVLLKYLFLSLDDLFKLIFDLIKINNYLAIIVVS